jgi:hypothetical protein
MSKKPENLLYLKAASGFDLLSLAQASFVESLKEPGPEALPKYYRARNYLRDAESAYAEAFKEAKRLVGPLPVAYSSAEFEKWRGEFVTQYRIITAGQDLDALKNEILDDSLFRQYIGPGDVERLMAKNFEAQRTGKRKLENLKVRILFDKLGEQLNAAQALAKEAREKFQAGR